MKKSELFFTTLLLPIDIIMIIAAFVVAYYIRIKAELLPVEYAWPFVQYLRFMIYLIPVWVAIFAFEGLYNFKNGRRGFAEFTAIFMGVSSVIALIVIWLFLTRTFFFSRLIIIYAWVLTIIFVSIARFGIRGIQRYLYRYNVGVQRLIIIGKDGLSKNIASIVQQNRKLGYKLIRILDRNAIQKLDKIFQNSIADEIILADPGLADTEVLKVKQFCDEKKIDFKLTPNLFKVRTAHVEASALAGIPILEFRRTPLEGWGKVIKRIFDIFTSAVALIILSPVMPIIAMAIKLDSKGPVIFRQKRVGYDRNFTFYKFRTMREDAEKYHNQYMKKYGIMFKLKNDPRVTKVGKFLRKTSLDEIPQLWNVFKGDMSLIGPRPPMPEEVKYYNQHQKKRLAIKPGATGLWQVSGRSELSFQEWVRLDVYYIENWSLWLDLQILYKTFGIIFRRKGAY